MDAKGILLAGLTTLAVIGCAESADRPEPTAFVQSETQATRSAEWLESEEYEQEKTVVEDWQDIREKSPEHYLGLRQMSGEIKRMTSNFRGRSSGSDENQAAMCWEVSYYRTNLDTKEQTAMTLQRTFFLENTLAFDEPYKEMAILYGMLNDHEKLCKDEYGIVPP